MNSKKLAAVYVLITIICDDIKANFRVTENFFLQKTTFFFKVRLLRVYYSVLEMADAFSTKN